MSPEGSEQVANGPRQSARNAPSLRAKGPLLQDDAMMDRLEQQGVVMCVVRIAEVAGNRAQHSWAAAAALPKGKQQDD